MTEESDLKSLRIGDEVMVSHGGNHTPDTVEIIERFTKTQIIIKNSSNKYNRETGRLIGGTAWTTGWLRKASEDLITATKKAQEKRKCVYFLTNFEWNKCSLGFLQSIKIAISECKK